MTLFLNKIYVVYTLDGIRIYKFKLHASYFLHCLLVSYIFYNKNEFAHTMTQNALENASFDFLIRS